MFIITQIPHATHTQVHKLLENTSLNNFRCVWIVRKLKEYYAVLHYKYRKRKWSAADASEPECVSHVELEW
jgi:hypothetical protein